MFKRGNQRVRFLSVFIPVFLIHTVSVWGSKSAPPHPKGYANSAQNGLNEGVPPASQRATPMKTVSDDPTTTPLQANSEQEYLKHGSAPHLDSQHSRLITSKEAGRSRTNKRVGDPARTLFEIQNTIRALANTHNELLRTITQNEPWWSRHYIQASWSYSKSHILNDKSLYLLLKSLSNFTLDEKILQDMNEGDFALPEEIQTYLQNLRCHAHGQTVQAFPKSYSFFTKEDWGKWKERLELIREEVRESKLKYDLEHQVHALIDKIVAFQDDFSYQYFRSHATWVYYFEDSWLNRLVEQSGGVPNGGQVTEKLRRVLKTLADKLQTWEQDFVHEWNTLIATVPYFELPKWLNQLWQLAVVTLKWGFLLVLSKIQSALSDPGAALLISFASLYILAYLIKLFLRQMGALIRHNSRRRATRWTGYQRERRSRVPIEDSTNFSEEGNNSNAISRSRLAEESNAGEFQNQHYTHPFDVGPATTRANEIAVEREPLVPLSPANISRISNESEVSFKMAKTSQGPARKGVHMGSVIAQGPIPRSKLTDSIRVGGRRINMVYDTRDEGDADDSREEIVAVVSSAKENKVKQSRKPLTKKNTKQGENRSDSEDSDMMRANATRRKTRRVLDDSKRLLVDVSNTSRVTEDTRVLRSRTNSATTKSTDGVAKQDTKQKSSIPRRRSARLSAAHFNEMRDE